MWQCTKAAAFLYHTVVGIHLVKCICRMTDVTGTCRLNHSGRDKFGMEGIGGGGQGGRGGAACRVEDRLSLMYLAKREPRDGQTQQNCHQHQLGYIAQQVCPLAKARAVIQSSKSKGNTTRRRGPEMGGPDGNTLCLPSPALAGWQSAQFHPQTAEHTAGLHCLEEGRGPRGEGGVTESQRGG